jgi:fatty acid desaturase
MQAVETSPRPITWYRTPLPPAVLKSLCKKSDFLGFVQALGYLGITVVTGATALYSSLHWALGYTLLLIILHGSITSCHLNAVHELGHGTVFKTRALNAFFEKVFAFLGVIHYELFDLKHARHHRYTVQDPEDPEITLPMKVYLREFLTIGIFNPGRLHWNLFFTWRAAKGRLSEGWERRLAPVGSPEYKRCVRWARILFVGHGAIIAFSIYYQLWALPLVICCSSGIFGSGIHAMVNLTQHIGLQDNVDDFRLCSRTVTLNPFLEFVMWHMNYHIEHHMYAAVPCYRLHRLHELVKYDMPPATHGLIATWIEIFAILAKQEKNPKYQFVVQLPAPRPAVLQPAIA